MGQANAHYYGSRDPLGADGDFTTAPEISQMFGELIGLTLADGWVRAGRPRVHYVELGPGRGTLARDALAAMARAGLMPPVQLVETSPALRARQLGLLPAAVHHASIDSLPRDAALLIVANEFFDALPIRQLVRTASGWRELLIGAAGERLVPAAGATPMDAAVPPALRAAPVGSRWESCPAGAAIAASLAERLMAQGGMLIIFDYGYAGPLLGDTLQAVRQHGFADPFADAGAADLTAHVDFSVLGAAAAAVGAAVTPLAAQGEWLVRLGIDARTAALTARHPARAAELQGQRDRLVKPDEMGQLFKVMAIHHPDWPLPAGFAA
jgi:SAM-dependent MidA family methyltransferase